MNIEQEFEDTKGGSRIRES